MIIVTKLGHPQFKSGWPALVGPVGLGLESLSTALLSRPFSDENCQSLTKLGHPQFKSGWPALVGPVGLGLESLSTALLSRPFQTQTQTTNYKLNEAIHNLKSGWPALGKRNKRLALLCNISNSWVF